jgi:tRNA threonylcarbamoyladenosine biosynthesis protein TsaE
VGKAYISKGYSQTKRLGFDLARKILKLGSGKKALVLGLKGDLGGGKTTFLQGFARGLKVKEKVLSPTFVIMRRFKIPKNKSCFSDFYHMDSYRIKKPKEIQELGFKKIVSSSNNIVAIEWADKISKALPEKTIWIDFDFIDKNKRKITVKSNQAKWKIKSL